MPKLILPKAIGFERQSPRLGGYVRSCLIADIESLAYYGGIHEIDFGYRRALSKRFHFCIYYSPGRDVLLMVAVIEAQRDPLWIRNRFE